MEFLICLIQTVIVAAFIAAVAYGGIICGKKLRVRKNAKIALESAETTTVEEVE